MILVVDDDAAVGKVLAGLLSQAGHEAQSVLGADAALEILNRRPVDVVITDLRMPGRDGMDLLSTVRQQQPDVPVIMLTAHGTVPIAVEAMKRGATDFLLKPFERDEVLFSVDRALRGRSTEHDKEPPRPARSEGFVGGALQEVMTLVGRVAPTEATVLVQGETGTGKELVARAIHRMSGRTGAFVAINCAALPDALLESELFGHEKGAFTGAVARKPGKAELASDGTLFLDEIGDLPMALQPKILRLLQEREFVRVGGTVTTACTARFVAATHRDLEGMVVAGTFRQDLFFRLCVVPIVLAPLRNCRDDVVTLGKAFLQRFGAEHSRHVQIAPDGWSVLQSQPWPGNVRELENFIERVVIMSDQAMISGAEVQRLLGKLPSATRTDEPATLVGERHAAERDAIVRALERAKHNRSLAARLLGISRRTLYNKLTELEIG